MKTAVHWFRADLRLEDNTALHAAVAAAGQVIPVFIFDPKILESPDVGANQVAFMIECLRELETSVKHAGGKLIFRHGQILEEMEQVLRQCRADALFYNRDYEPYARERDASVEKLARKLGVEVHSFKDNVLQEPHEILKGDGKPYRVFTPYKNAWRTATVAKCLPPVRFPKSNSSAPTPRGITLPTAAKLGFKDHVKLPPAGETAAHQRLRHFVRDHLSDYARGRDIPADGATSRLSPDLRLGVISPRTVFHAAARSPQRTPHAKKSVDTFTGELIWRDFYKAILWHYPHVAQGAYRPEYDKLKWTGTDKLFQAWCEGRTGYPIVDAGMRQLKAIGWMHNRLRMITAAFLVKDLHVSWQKGERYFMQKLLDADLAANNGGWQWSAGTGTDAQPWFRIFNPIAQAKKFDPEGRFIHQYIPEIDTKDYPRARRQPRRGAREDPRAFPRRPPLIF